MIVHLVKIFFSFRGKTKRIHNMKPYEYLIFNYLGSLNQWCTRKMKKVALGMRSLIIIYYILSQFCFIFLSSHQLEKENKRLREDLESIRQEYLDYRSTANKRWDRMVLPIYVLKLLIGWKNMHNLLCQMLKSVFKSIYHCLFQHSYIFLRYPFLKFLQFKAEVSIHRNHFDI